MDIPEFDLVEKELPLKSQASIKKTPLAENYALIQQHYKEKSRLASERQKSQQDEDKILAQLGTEIFVLGKYLDEIKESMAAKGLQEELRGLVIQQEKMVELLNHQGMALTDLTGERLTLELLDKIKVLGWVTEDGLTAPRVKETKAPMIYRHQRLVQGGVVVGARPSEAPEQK